MQKERFNELMNDTKNLKINDNGYYHFKNEINKIVIEFLFSHVGIRKSSYSINPERVFLNVIPIETFNKDIPTTLLETNTIIIVNADEYDYATSFRIIDENKNKIIKLEIVDNPNLEGYITSEHIKDLLLTY